MASPIITFKAGQCDLDTSSETWKVKPQPERGYVYIYLEDELVHFCWRKRDNSNLEQGELDLVMVPEDGSFVPYTDVPQSSSKPNGRIFVLKFASSSQRHFFWMQSKPQSQDGDPSWFSPRDRKIGDIVHRLLQGEEVNVTRELARVNNTDDRRQNDSDDDEDMEDVEGERAPSAHRGSGSGGAGADATGGDVREEGENSREGGSDGARAVSSSGPDAASAVRNFLDSLKGGPSSSPGQGAGGSSDKPYPYLNHLLPTSITVPMIDAASEERIDALLDLLPPSVIVLASELHDAFDGKNEPMAEVVEAARESLELEDKRSLLKKVMRSPQFHQALGILTMALRDGGLPGVADALDVKVENGGYLQQGGMPLGGGQAVEAFVEGVKKTVQEKKR